VKVNQRSRRRTPTAGRPIGRLDRRGTATIAHQVSIAPEAGYRVKEIRAGLFGS
jgi:hypothetical protein